MSELINGLALPFERFVAQINPIWSAGVTISFVHPQHSYSVHLIGSIANEVPEKVRRQSFDEQYLMPIAKGLGLDQKNTAILLALRNAWIAYFQESKVSKISVNEIRLLMTHELAIDYVVLMSNKWFEHPWIREQISHYQAEVPPVSLFDEKICAMHYQARKETPKDINYFINAFRNQKGAYTTSTTLLEMDADDAGYDIKRAKKRIRELHAELHVEIEKQEAIIREATKPIRKFQNYERALKKRAPGRPKISEMSEQQERRNIATKFVAQWVSSLMSALSIPSCGELAKMVGGQKMTWWRWQNNKTLPPSSYLESLLDLEIKKGEHKSTKLRDIKTAPLLTDLISLVDLV